MCIVAIAWQLFDGMPLVLLSNRDEFFDRPTTPAHHWSDAPIFAGRDDKSGGTWLGHDLMIDANQKNSQKTSQNGRWAAVLNFRDGVPATDEQRSRGELVTHFLTSKLSPLSYARQVKLQAYAGFNLIVGDAAQAVVVNNRGYAPTPLYNGLHIFSNGQPDAKWFKCERLRRRVRQEVLPLISESLLLGDVDEQTILNYWQPAAWQVLSDTVQAPANRLPDTGVPTDIEHALSAICVDTQKMPNYGTRTQSIMTVHSISKDYDNGQPNFMTRLMSREYQSER